ncbi:MAG: hypothetical protein ABFC84_11420 [Veillonellales bacterium]
MQDQLHLLWEIQKLEQEKNSLQSQADRLSSEKIRILCQEINSLTESITASRNRLSAMQQVYEKQEKEVGFLMEQYHLIEQQLYSGEIKNPKELEQLKGRCDGAKADIDQREEKIFAEMAHCEQLEQQIMDLQTQVADKQQQCEQRRQEFTQAVAVVEKGIQEIDEKIKRLTVKISLPILDKYRELHRKLRFPIAKVENGICSGCHRSLPVTQVSRQAATLMYCDNCGRILLIGEA